MEIKSPKFYLDKSGTYGDVAVSCDKLREIKGRNRLYVEVALRGNRVLTANAEYMHLQMWAREFSPEEMYVLNESLIQLDNFRGLMLIMQNNQWFVIVDGQKVQFVSGMEFCMNNGDYFIAVPYQAPEKKVKGKSGMFEYVIRYETPRTGNNDEGYF